MLRERLVRVGLTPIESLRELGGASQAQVWRAQGDGWIVAAKLHHSQAGLRRETEALAALAPLQGQWIPSVHSCADGLIVSEWIEGEQVSTLPEGDPRLLAAHEQAGRFCAAMYALPCPSDPMPVGEAIARRWQRCLAHAAALLEPELFDRLSRRRDDSCFEGLPRRWCHRDFEARNWILDGEGKLWVIDFGQSRPDFWLCDLAKLETSAWTRRPALRRAFFRGLGRELSARETRALAQIVVLHGLQTAVWGYRHGEPVYRELGLAILRQAL